MAVMHRRSSRLFWLSYPYKLVDPFFFSFSVILLNSPGNIFSRYQVFIAWRPIRYTDDHQQFFPRRIKEKQRACTPVRVTAPWLSSLGPRPSTPDLDHIFWVIAVRPRSRPSQPPRSSRPWRSRPHQPWPRWIWPHSQPRRSRRKVSGHLVTPTEHKQTINLGFQGKPLVPHQSPSRYANSPSQM